MGAGSPGGRGAAQAVVERGRVVAGSPGALPLAAVTGVADDDLALVPVTLGLRATRFVTRPAAGDAAARATPIPAADDIGAR
jgi:hypothetical protein